MTTTSVYLMRSCAHCGSGCDAREHECSKCRFYYCEKHEDPHTHDCHTVCVEVRREELDEVDAEALRHRAQLSLALE